MITLQMRRDELRKTFDDSVVEETDPRTPYREDYVEMAIDMTNGCFEAETVQRRDWFATDRYHLHRLLQGPVLRSE